MKTRTLIMPVATVLLILPGCDSTGPDEDAVAIAISVDASGASVAPTDAGGRQVTCDVTFTAVATGAPNAVATWDGGALRWYAGIDQSVALQVDSLSTADVREMFQGSELMSGDTAVAYWSYWAPVPFIVEADFRYTTGSGAPRTETARLECGLGLAGEAGPPPVISELAFDAPTPFQPGDEFTVSYLATATAGLWHSTVTIDGAYQKVQENVELLDQESRRTFEFVVPPGVTLGAPIDIVVEAVDAFGRTSAPVSITSAPLVDVTPPAELAVTTGNGFFNEFVSLVGQYAVGETMGFRVITWDNHQLGDLTIQVGPDVYTYRPGSPVIDSVFEIPTRPGLVGAPGFSIGVTDAQGLAGPHYEATDSIRIFPVSLPPIASLTAPGGFRDAAWDAASDRLYVTRGGMADVLVVSTATLNMERTIELPGTAAGIDFTAGGDSLVVTLEERGTIAIVDLNTDQVTELPLASMGFIEPGRIVALEGAEVLVEVDDSMGVLQVAHIDLSTGTVISSTIVPGTWVERVQLARTPDRSVVGAHSNEGCLMVFTAATQQFDTCTYAGSTTGTLSVDATGSHFLVAQHLTDVAPRALRQPAWGVSPRSIYAVQVSAFSADGASFYLADPSGLTRVRMSDGVALERIPMPLVYGRVLTAPDGSELLTLSNDLDAASPVFTIQRITLQ